MALQILDILTTDTDPGGILTTPCVDAVPSPETSLLLHAMVDTLKATPGALGLAAPQVGVSVRAFVMGSEEQGWLAFLNPVIIERSAWSEVLPEGCLSQPNKQVRVRRPIAVTVKGQDAEGNPFKFKAKGLAARVVCHEIAHLKGELI